MTADFSCLSFLAQALAAAKFFRISVTFYFLIYPLWVRAWHYDGIIMTENRAFKKLIRNRMQLKGESYSAARRKLMFLASQPGFAFGKTRALDDLFDDVGLAKLLPMLGKNSGLIVVAGSTGCGKTTTLKALLDYQARVESRRVILVESFGETDFEASSLTAHLIGDKAVGGLYDSEQSFVSDVLHQSLRMGVDTVAIQELHVPGCLPDSLYAVSDHVQVMSTVHSLYPSDALDFYNLGENFRDHASSFSGVIEQARIVDDSVPGKPSTVVTNVVDMTPQLIEIWQSKDRAAEAEYFADPATWNMAHKLLDWERQGLIQRTSAGSFRFS